jgi:hypothetical protein
MSAIEPRDLLRNNNPIPPSGESTIREYRTGIKTAGVKLAVICCPWPQYRDLAPTARTRVFTPWRL